MTSRITFLISNCRTSKVDVILLSTFCFKFLHRQKSHTFSSRGHDSHCPLLITHSSKKACVLVVHYPAENKQNSLLLWAILQRQNSKCHSHTILNDSSRINFLVMYWNLASNVIFTIPMACILRVM
jgi:hypothetical protein